MAVLLTRRAVLQAAMESVYNTPATVTLNDGILVSEPVYTAEPSLLERDFTRDTLSQQAHIVGRLLSKMEFSTELRGNSKEQSGALIDAPILTRLFRACGYAITAGAAAAPTKVYEADVHANPVAFVAAGPYTNTDLIKYTLEVTTPGASGTAKVTVVSETAGESMAAASITTASPFTVGTKGLKVTPTFVGSLVNGQRWTVWLLPVGLMLAPISTNMESVTLVMNKDGVKHSMPGSFGTFEIEATAGDYAKVKWTFWGTYLAPVDAAMASPVYERTLPAQVENARLSMDGFAAIVEKFTFNQGNDVQVRPDVNSPQGYIGTRIVSRKPEGGIDPEASLVADYDFWGKLRAAARMSFQMRIGNAVGNTVWVLAPSVQYTRMTYQDRQGLLTYDAGLKFSGYQADDEVFFYFA